MASLLVSTSALKIEGVEVSRAFESSMSGAARVASIAGSALAEVSALDEFKVRLAVPSGARVSVT